MVPAKLHFENGKVAHVHLPTRPIVGESIIYNNDRYQIKEVSHLAVEQGVEAAVQATMILRLGIGRKGAHPQALERSPRGFYTGLE